MADLGEQLRLCKACALGCRAGSLQLVDQGAGVERHHRQQRQVRKREQRILPPIRRQPGDKREAKDRHHLAQVHGLAPDAEAEPEDGEQVEAHEQRGGLAGYQQPGRQHERVQDGGGHQQAPRPARPLQPGQVIGDAVVEKISGGDAADFPCLGLRTRRPPVRDCGEHRHHHHKTELEAQAGLRADAACQFRG